MDGVLKSITDPINKALAPLYDLINKAFEYNKFLAGGALATFITVALFFLMVALISLGDTGIKTDNSRKLADVIMPERDIDTLFDDFEKPEEPEEPQESDTGVIDTGTPSSISPDCSESGMEVHLHDYPELYSPNYRHL